MDKLPFPSLLADWLRFRPYPPGLVRVPLEIWQDVLALRHPAVKGAERVPELRVGRAIVRIADLEVD